MNTAKVEIDHVSYLEERVSYLEEANCNYAALLDMLTSCSDFQADLNRDKSLEGIYRATLVHLGRLFPFQGMGILESKDDNSFDLAACEPTSCWNGLSNDIDSAIMNGTFAWALKRNQAITVPAVEGNHTLLLHAIATQTGIRGMFIARLAGKNRLIDAPTINTLSSILLTSAYSLENCALYTILREHSQSLEEKVQERTAELLTARNMAEAAALELQISNEQLSNEIAERKRAEDELIKAQKLESLGVFAGGIAHDFNNILTSILANLSFARMQISPSHLIARRLEECEKATVRASELTQQLLTFARGGEPVKKLIDPVPIIKEAASFVLRGSTVRSRLDLPDGLWCVEADGGQFSQALHNLLINAAQAMPDGGEVTVRGENETLGTDNLHRLPAGPYLKITVEDSGCGIPEENLSRIFDPYYTTKSQGSGLGLASVYSIAKRHGGTVGISSKLGEGSIFDIHLPASPGNQPAGVAVKEATELRGAGRILIMDDEDFIREIATEILQYMGYDAESCADGKEAVECFQKAREIDKPFACIILDLTVPGGMGGKEAAARLRELDPDAVLIVSSGYSNDPIIANYQNYGFNGAIRKPFDADTLARELAKLIPKSL